MTEQLKDLGRIGILMGGYSSERDISLKSGQAVAAALAEGGGDVVAIDIIEREPGDILSRIQRENIDVAFIALHGRLGEDGQIQFILEEAGVPYTGSGVDASQRSLNKILAAERLNAAGLRVPEHIAVTQGEDIDQCLEKISFSPWVVKPACEGSSLGISLVFDQALLKPAIESCWAFGHECLVEQYVKGRELTVGIFGQKPLPVVEIKPGKDFFDFSAKYQKGETEYIVPAPISPEMTENIQAMAWSAHQVMGCVDLSRVDFILDELNQPYLLEINTIPGFTATSLLPKAAQTIGVNFNQLCTQLVRMAYDKKEKNKNFSLHC